jgi:hypothetical protein
MMPAHFKCQGLIPTDFYVHIGKNSRHMFAPGWGCGGLSVFSSIMYFVRISLKMKKPFEMMAFCNDNSTWQVHMESNLFFQEIK